MNFPDLPTDNLYKFMAIAGLFILFGSGVLSYLMLDKLDAKIMSIQQSFAINEIELAKLDADIGATKKSTSDLKTVSQNKDFNSLSKSQQDIFLQQFQQVQNDVKEENSKHIQIEENMAKLKATENFPEYNNDLSLVEIILWGGGLSGLLITCNGFYLWYVRLQKYQDAFLKAKLKKLESGN